MPDTAFLARLRATFRDEAQEHLQAIGSGLLQLEQAPPGEPLQPAVLEGIFRAAHSLKGAARAVEAREVETLCQLVEDTFADWRRGACTPTIAALDELHQRLRRMAALLDPAAPVAARVGPPAAAEAPVAPRVGPRATAEAAAAATVGPLVAAETPPWLAGAALPAAGPADTVRVAVETLNDRLLEAEELLAVKLVAQQRATELQELAGMLRAARGARPERMPAIEARVAALAQAAEQDRAAAAKAVDALLATSKQLLQLPFASVAAGLPLLVRELSREQGKEAVLQLEGQHVELDKRVLDALRDPLVHLLRNAVDHGVEPPADRLRRGLFPRAQLRLAAEAAPSGRVRITLADDGPGIDAARVRAAAVAQGVLTADAAARLSDEAARRLVFHSGLTTCDAVTQLSGRGLGLAIVQEQVARLGGEVSVQNRPGGGTEFRVLVPAKRTTFRGVLVEAGGRPLLFPTTEVAQVARVRHGELRTVEGRTAVALGGQLLPVAWLGALLGFAAPAAVAGSDSVPLVVAGSGEARVAFAVDAVLDESEFLVKWLQRPLVRVRHVAAGTVLAGGRIGLILRVPELLRAAREPASAVRPALAATAPSRPRSVLVAEDSITSRLLIKGVLEAAGFRVTTAVDGLDAIARLRAEPCDLVVSDVEMPRLDGYGLTERIRADARLARTPVVLVTALEDPLQRARGLAAGADAYIGKSGFEDRTLVDVVQGLL
jgi:two-component system chemotaxis sensor kinase CheA